MNIFIDTILKNPKKRILKDMSNGEVRTFEIQDDLDNVIQEGNKLTSELFERFRIEVMKDLRPIGSIYSTEVNEDPKETFGFGRWERILGKTIVGVDETDEDFSQVNKTGGEKKHQLETDEMPASAFMSMDAGNTEASWCAGEIKNYPAGTYKINKLSVTRGKHNNLQPYECYYIWKRVE